MANEEVSWPASRRIEQAWDAPMINFRSISADGREEILSRGLVWGPAPPWRRGRSIYVRPLLKIDDHEVVEPVLVRVALVTVRHRCGRAGRGGRVLPTGGRWMDPGEAYSDIALRAGQRAAWEDHIVRLGQRWISTEPLDPWLFDFLSDPELFVLS